jgi:P-type Ca2+ transporter type 2C
MIKRSGEKNLAGIHLLETNQIEVKQVYLNGRLADVDRFYETDHCLAVFMQILVLCNNSRLTKADKSSEETPREREEKALLRFAAGKGFHKSLFEKIIPQINAIPLDFTSELMTTVHELNSKYRVMIKGSPEVLFDKCNKILWKGRPQPVTDSVLTSLTRYRKIMENRAPNVIAVAYKDIDQIPENLKSEDLETNLVFVGMVGLTENHAGQGKHTTLVFNLPGIKPVNDVS